MCQRVRVSLHTTLLTLLARADKLTKVGEELLALLLTLADEVPVQGLVFEADASAQLFRDSFLDTGFGDVERANCLYFLFECILREHGLVWELQLRR